jgi:hypothetical protein
MEGPKWAHFPLASTARNGSFTEQQGSGQRIAQGIVQSIAQASRISDGKGGRVWMLNGWIKL